MCVACKVDTWAITVLLCSHSFSNDLCGQLLAGVTVGFAEENFGRRLFGTKHNTVLPVSPVSCFMNNISLLMI